MAPRQDSLNSCFSEVTGRGDIDAACFPRQLLNTAGQWCTPGHRCAAVPAPRKSPMELPLHVEAAPRLTAALLEASEALYKLTAPSASPTETSEQLCRLNGPLQATAVKAVSAAQQPHASQLEFPCKQQVRQVEADISDTASETGSSSTPPPRKGRRRTPMCRNPSTKAAARKLQPPPPPAYRPAQTPFPWARTTASELVQKLLAMQAADRCPSPEAVPPRKAAKLAPLCSPGRQTSCPAALPTCPTACPTADLATPACPELPVGAAQISADLPGASKAGSLPSGVAEWRVQVWPVPQNCTYAAAVPREA